MNAGETFQGLPGWAKGVIAVVGTGVVVLVGYGVYRAVSGRIKHAKDYQETGQVKNDLQELATQGTKPSYMDSQYLAWANQIFKAFDGYGSDESAVYRVFVNMKNDADVLMLIKAYGVRIISSGAGNPEPNFKGTLAGAITEEMDTEEVKEINLILAKRGIKVRF